MVKTSTRDKWKNIIAYVVAVHDRLNDHDMSHAEQEELCQERYRWLEENYQVAWNQRTLKKLRK
jgi:hypothetical protein